MRSEISRLRARFGSKFCGSQAFTIHHQLQCFIDLHGIFQSCSIRIYLCKGVVAGSPNPPKRSEPRKLRAVAASSLLVCWSKSWGDGAYIVKVMKWCEASINAQMGRLRSRIRRRGSAFAVGCVWQFYTKADVTRETLPNFLQPRPIPPKHIP